MTKSKEWIEEAIDILEHILDKKFSPKIFWGGRYQYEDNLFPYLEEKGAIILGKGKKSIKKGKLLMDVLRGLRLEVMQEEQHKLLENQNNILKQTNKIYKLIAVITILMTLATFILAIKG